MQKFEDISVDEKNILCVKPFGTILGKSEICEMTKVSGAHEKRIYNGNTVLIKISEENDKHRWVYISGDRVYSFLTNDDFYKYISKMGNNLTPYSFAIVYENFYFLTPHFRYIKRRMVNSDEIWNTNEKSVGPYDLCVSRCGIHSFKKNKNI